MTAVKTFVQHIIEQQQGVTHLILKKAVRQPEIIFIIQHIEILNHALIRNVSTGKAYHLIEDGKCITHTAIRLQRNDIQRFGFCCDILFRSHISQMLHRVFHTDTVKIINLATRQNSRKNLMLLRRRQNKDSMTGRFLQCFQKSIESRDRQHMYLIDNIHLILTDLWRNPHLLYQLADIIYRIIGRGIQFMNVIGTLFIESHTRLTCITSLSILSRSHTVDSLGKDTCTRGFSYSTRPAKQIGMRQFLRGNGILQCRSQCPLAHHRLKGRRTIFTGRYNIVFHTSGSLCFLSFCKCTQKK